MKVREAIEILRQMNPDKEVKLVFGSECSGNRDYYDDCQPGSNIPGESQEERFGNCGQSRATRWCA
jgi:hypothetical protein